jgi:hypothetical protein
MAESGGDQQVSIISAYNVLHRPIRRLLCVNLPAQLHHTCVKVFAIVVLTPYSPVVQVPTTSAGSAVQEPVANSDQPTSSKKRTHRSINSIPL